MLMQAIIVARIVRRKTNMMSAVRIIEAMMSPKTPFIERMMKRALSETTTSVVPTGAVLFSSAMRSCMRRESATSLAPRCLRMLTMMAGLPSYIDELRASSRPSSTRATSRSRMTAPSRTAMGRYSSSAAEACPRLDAPRGQLDVLVVYRVLDFLRGYAVALERLGVEPDAHLALAEAGELHAADAAHRLEALLHDLVDVARERLHVRAPVVLDRDAHNRAVARVELVYLRLVAVVGQRAERAAHLVAHVRGREVYVAVELELHDDDGAPLVAARAHALDSFDCVDARFEHVRHVVVDDGGARALERRAHDDYREFDVRHPLDAHVHVRVSAEDYGGDRDDEDRYRPAQRNFRDFHEASSPCIVYIFSHT